MIVSYNKQDNKGHRLKGSEKISPFWYRRIAEIAMLVSGALLGLWLVSLLTHQATILGFEIPLSAGILAGATIIAGGVCYLMRTSTLTYYTALATYLLLLTTSLAVIFSTGHEGSPFIALWMLVSVFAGIFGLKALLPVSTAVSGYLVYLIILGVINTQEIAIFALAFYLPLAISYLIWHNQSLEASEQDTAFSALAQELSQVANKSEIVINAIADGVIAVDEQSVIQLINPAAQTLIGWGKQDALKLDYHSVFKLVNDKEQALDEAHDPVQQVLRTHEVVSTSDVSLLTMSGKRISISLKVSPISEKGAGAIVVFRDITAELAEERQQAEFISTASHEMRTPVAAIEGYLGLALNPQTATIDDKAKVYLQRAHESAQHLGRLFQDLLDVSKSEDGRMQNNLTLIDVVATVRAITQSMEATAKAKNLQLNFLPDLSDQSFQRVSPVFYSMLDIDHFREIISNLVENAIKYTFEGHIDVDIEGDETHTRVTVTDTGVGIPTEDIPHLFQKFYRVDNSDTREIGGTGLGLYLSRRLAEAMGGRIDLKSELGKGSTFSAEFERVRQEEAMSYIEAHAQPAAEVKTTKAL